MNRYIENRGCFITMLASFLKRDPKNLIQKDASLNFQVQNDLLWLHPVGEYGESRITESSTRSRTNT